MPLHPDEIEPPQKLNIVATREARTCLTLR
jgi:hypothetical protein